MIHVDIEQNTEEWLQLRAGKITASKAGVIMAKYGKAFGEPAKKYASTLAVERITGRHIPSDYQNSHMERGKVEELQAIEEYKAMSFKDVSPGGFFHTDTLGYSPDGLVGDGGLIEVKSVIPSQHYANIKRQDVDPAYKWQCLFGLWLSDRDYLDFVSYCSVYPEGRKVFCCRIDIKSYEEEFIMISSRVSDFEKMVIEAAETIKSSKYFV